MLIKESSIADSIILYLQIYVWFCKQETERLISKILRVFQTERFIKYDR